MTVLRADDRNDLDAVVTPEESVRAAYTDGELSESLHGAAVAARRFADQLRAEAVDLDTAGSVKKVMPRLGAEGLLGTMIPTAYGGQGLDLQHNVVIQEQLAAVAPSLAALRAVCGVFVAQPLLRFGSGDQIGTWLPRLADGTVTSALAITEPDAGSDPGSMTTRAVRTDDGYELTGMKHFISGSSEGEFIFTYCVTDPGAPSSSRFSAFLVPTDLPGVDASEQIETLGVRGLSHSTVRFDRVRLDPEKHLVGKAGQGLEIMEYGLVPERIDIAARAVGCARGAYVEACRHARERVQFGRPLQKFQAVSHRIADMATRVRAADLLTMNAAKLYDRGLECRADAAMAKLFAAEQGFGVCDDAMQVLGSKGYALGRSPVELMFRDIRVLRMGGGTDEIMRHIIQSEVLRSVR
jgi:hypothetical protein